MIVLLFFAAVAEGVTVAKGGVAVAALLIDDEQFMLCKWSEQRYGPCSEPCPALQIEHTGLPQASLFPPAAEKVQMWWVGMTLHIEQVTEVEEASMMLNGHGRIGTDNKKKHESNAFDMHLIWICYSIKLR